jgi:uncharacterized protein
MKKSSILFGALAGAMLVTSLFAINVNAAIQKNTIKGIKSNAQTESVQIKRDNLVLSGTLQVPALENGKKCPLVIIMHGFMDSSSNPMHVSIANQLSNKGIASLRFDFNGHGQSEGQFIDMTVLNEIEDGNAVYNYVRKLNYVSNIGLIGHSQGGVVAGMLAGQLGNKITSLVQMAPAAVLKDDALAGNIFGIKFDPNNIPEYIDIYSHKLGREYIKTAQTLPIYETSAQFKGSACLIHGKADIVVPYSYSERYNKVYSDSEIHLLDNEDHGFQNDQNLATGIAVDFFEKKLF